MFASWSGGEYGSVGATEWLEVRPAALLRRLPAATWRGCRSDVCVRSGLPVVSEHEGLRLHQPGRRHHRYVPQDASSPLLPAASSRRRLVSQGDRASRWRAARCCTA